MKPKRPRRSHKAIYPVHRDPTFSRVTLDKALIVPLGRDLEISCLQSGPLIERIINSKDAEKLELNPIYSEVARIRLGWPEAINLAMNILQAGIFNNTLNRDKLLEFITDMISSEGAVTESGKSDAD